MKLNSERINLLFIFAIGALLFTYVSYKASINGFTHDESYSYLVYTQHSFFDLLAFKGWYTNNHILNSIGMKYAAILFGTSELALRSPNLIALAIYMVFGYLMFRDSNPLIAIPVFVLLCTNLLITDLFGLARGYGLSFGFMIMSLYYLTAYFKERKNWHIIFFHLGALLASLSNFTLLSYYVSAMAVYGMFSLIYQSIVLGEKLNVWSIIKPHMAPVIFVGIVLYEPIRRVLTYTELNFGGSNGFYQDTVHQVIFNLLHNNGLPTWAMVTFQVLLTGLVLVSLIVVIRKAMARDKTFFGQQQGFIITTLILVTISVLIILLHLFLGSDYPISRFAAFLIVLIIVQFGFVMRYLPMKGNKLASGVLAGLALVSLTSFVIKTDLNSSAEWEYDMYTKDMLITLEQYHNEHGKNDKVNLGIHWIFDPTINFYKETKELDWLEPVNRDGFEREYDYYYIFKEDLPKLDAYNLEVVKEYEESKSILLFNRSL